MQNIDWKLIFDKVGTIIVDRRFWLKFVFPTVFAVGLFPHLADQNIEVLTDQAVGWAKLIMTGVVPVISAYLLSIDWTNRAPSGLRFKEIPDDISRMAEALVKALKEN